MGGKLHWSRMFHGNPTSVGRNNIWDNKNKCSPTAHSILKISRALPNSCIASPKRFKFASINASFKLKTCLAAWSWRQYCNWTFFTSVQAPITIWWRVLLGGWAYFWHISLRVLLSHQLKPITKPPTGNDLRYSFRCVWELHDLTDLKSFYSKHQKGSPTSTRTKRTI